MDPGQSDHTLLAETSLALATAANGVAALGEAVAIVCRRSGWTYGEAWEPASDGALHLVGTWHGEDEGVARFAELSRSILFAPGEGLVGTVFEDGRPHWVRDSSSDPLFVRRAEAARAGLGAVIAVPVIADDHAIATLVFFRRERSDEDRSAMETIAAVAAQVGGALARIRADDRLRESQQRFRALVDAVVDYAIITLDPRGNVETWNTGAARMKGYEAREIVGRHFSVFYTEEDRAKGRPAEVLEIASGAGNHVEESVRVRKDGTRFPALVSMSASRSESGELLGFIKVTRDLTRAIEGERAIGHLASIVDASSDSIIRVSLEGMIETWNPGAERLFGYQPTEAVGRHFSMLVPEDRRSEAAAVFGRVLSGTSAPPYDTVRRHKDGSSIDVSLTVSPIVDPEGVVIGAASIARDIGSRKREEELRRRFEQELIERNRDLEQFAAVASHDLQEPLRMVAGYTELLARRYKGRLDAEADEFIGYAVDGALRMQRLINDLLAYSRIGSKGPDLSDVDMNEIVSATLNMMAGAIEEAAATVQTDPLPVVRADRTNMLRLMQNLVGNALKYRSEQPPHVEVSWHPTPEGPAFTVRDNGIGIEPQHLERIFQVFQRLHGRGEYEGTGIGLAICQKIVERHGGRIWAESEPGKGSTFVFTLGSSEV